MKYIFFSILTGLAFWQCQTPAPAPKNILNCYVRYDAASRKVKAEASLLDGATKQIIDFRGGIRFQATAMKLFPVRGIKYDTEYAAAYLPEQVFEWKNNKGEIRQYQLMLPSIDSFFFDTKELSIKNSAHLQWIGKPLENNETLVFIWENQVEGKTVPMEVSTTLGEALIEIPAAKIAQVGPGEWTLYLVRKRPGKAELNDFLVESMAEYYTKPIKLTIKAK